MAKSLYSFTLDPLAADIVDACPKYKPKKHKGKSAMVSRAIRKYGDDAILSPQGRKHYEAIIGQLNSRIIELEQMQFVLYDELVSHPPLEASSSELLNV